MFDVSNSQPIWGSLKFDDENIKFVQITLLTYTHYCLGKAEGKGSAKPSLNTQLLEYPALVVEFLALLDVIQHVYYITWRSK